MGSYNWGYKHGNYTSILIMITLHTITHEPLSMGCGVCIGIGLMGWGFGGSLP